MPLPHVDDLDPKALRLRTLVRIHGTDADLDQAGYQILLHNAGEGTGMGVAVALVLVVEVRMCVEMQDGQILVPGPIRLENGIGDCVVTAERHDVDVALEQAPNRHLNLLKRSSATGKF